MWDFFGTEGGRTGWKGYAILWLRVAFGAHCLVSGLNYFFPFAAPPAINISPAGLFINEMDAVGLFALIKVVEVIAGVLLITNRFVPLALAIEMPTTLSIFYLNTFVDGMPRQLYTGPRELFYNGILILAYWAYFRAILSPKAVLASAWNGALSSEGTNPITAETTGKVLP